LLLESGSRRTVIVSVDCCLTNEQSVLVPDPQGKEGYCREFIPTFSEGTRSRWANAAGTDSEGIAVCATHTHTAPASYSEKYTDRIERLIEELGKKLMPVKFSVAQGQSDISAFRRPTLRADRSVPVNQELTVLSIETVNGDPIGAVVNYAVHPTGLRNPANRISGDIVGLAMSDLEKRYGNDFTAMFLQGFSGDVCPVYGDNGPTEDTYADVLKGSLHFSSDIQNAIEHKVPVSISSFQSLTRQVSFPTRKRFVVPEMKVTLFGLNLGDVLMVTVSGEVFNDYIAFVERESPARYNLLAGVSNGYSGYLPTYKAFHDGLGGYEMNTTPYTDELEALFMGEIRRFFESFERC